MMPYFAAVAGFSSTLSFTIFTLPFIVPASSSSAGAIILQGPHHSAQKSTTTGWVLVSTSASKSVSETFETPMAHLVFSCCGRCAPLEETEAEAMHAPRKRQGTITAWCYYACFSLDIA